MLAVRLTTTPKPDLPSIVASGAGEPFVGSVVCDDIVELWTHEVRRDMGANAAHVACHRGAAGMRSVDTRTRRLSGFLRLSNRSC